MGFDSKTFNRAVRRYIGYGITSFPNEDPARLITEFGPELGSQLNAQASALLEELNRVKPDTDNLILSSRRAAVELKEKYPELDPDTIDALEWIYSWWWK